MKGAVRFAAIAIAALTLAAVWACSSSTTSRNPGTTAGAAAPATPVPSEPSTASAPSAPASSGRTGQTGTMAGTAAGAATAAAGAAAGSLTDTLGTSLGLTADQASGAVGSVLALAQEKLPASDYTKVATAVPGADTYVQKAKDLGAVSGSVGDASGLAAAYAKLGISPEVASQVTPLVVSGIGKVGGPTVQSLLSSVVK